MKLFGYPISCWFEFHKWSRTKRGVRICRKCNMIEYKDVYNIRNRRILDKNDIDHKEDFDLT